MCITKTNHFLQRTSLPPCFLLSLPRATFLLRLFLARRAECSSVRVASIRRIAQLHVQRVRDHSSGHRSVRLRSRPRRSQIKLRNVPPQRFARLLPPRAPRVAPERPRRAILEQLFRQRLAREHAHRARLRSPRDLHRVRVFALDDRALDLARLRRRSQPEQDDDVRGRRRRLRRARDARAPRTTCADARDYE